MSSIIKKMYFGFSILLVLFLMVVGVMAVKQEKFKENLSNTIEFDVGMAMLSSDTYSKLLESKNLEKTIIINLADSNKMSESKKSWDSVLLDIKQKTKSMLAITEKSGEDDVKKSLLKFQTDLEKYELNFNKAYESAYGFSGKNNKDSLALFENLKNESDAVLKTIFQVYEGEHSHIKHATDEVLQEAQNVKEIVIYTSVGLCVFLLFISVILINSVKTPLIDFKTKARDIVKNNDLTIKFEDNGGEFGEIAKDMNNVLDVIRQSISVVINNSKQTLSSAESVSENSEKISISITKQSDSISDSAAAIEELTVSINQVAELSKSIKNNMGNVTDLSKFGVVLSNETKEIIQQIEVVPWPHLIPPFF